MLSSAMSACLTDGVNPRSGKRQNSSSGNDSRETQCHNPLISDGNQNHVGVLSGDGNGEPSGHPEDG